MKLKLTLLFVIIAGIIFLDQVIHYGIIWEWNEIHHETWIIMFLFGALLTFILKK